jgi:hypothetical protein
VSGYAGLVQTLLARLVILFAVLLMPLDMAPAAASVPHQRMDMPMGHCPDQGSHHDMKSGIAECTMACAGALPAADLARHQPLLVVCEPIQPAAAQRLHGLHPDPATPPPKDS